MECTADINAANAARAAKERPGVKFASVDVSITKIDNTSVWFTTRGVDDNPHPYTCRKSDVWLECPSTAQRAGERGSLLLSSAALTAKSLKDGATRIKGTTPDLTGKVQVSVKWPDNAGDAEPVAALEIWPTKIIIEGYAHGDKSFQGTISLLNPRDCSTAQLIQLDSGGPITLMLTDDGFHQFSLAMPTSATADLSQLPDAAAPGEITASNGEATLPETRGNGAAIWEELIGYLADAVVERLRRDEGSRRKLAPRAAQSAQAPAATAPAVTGAAVRQVIERIAHDFADLKKAISAS